MLLFNKKYIESNKIANDQWQYVKGMRKAFQHNQAQHVQTLLQTNARREDILANEGIGMLDFWQTVDKRLVSIRQNPLYAICKDIESLATPVSIGALSSVNLMAKDISDDVTRSMDMGGKVSHDNLGSDYDKNPIPVFSAGIGMNYRTYMGQQDAQLGLYAESIVRKTVKLTENIGDYMYNGDADLTADGQAGEGIKNHRNTSKLDLGASGYNINLTDTGTLASNDDIVSFYIKDILKIIDDNALSTIDVQWVSPEIYRRLQQPVGGTGEFKDGSMQKYLEAISEIGSIQKDYSLSGNEFIMYNRDQQIISPLIALPITGFQNFRDNPYANFNQTMISVQGLRVAKTYNSKYGVFYASNIT